MASNFEKYRNMIKDFEYTKESIQHCLGNKLVDERGVFIVDPEIEKHNFKFAINSSNQKQIYLNAYYSYYGDKGIHSFSDEFYIQCLVEALNDLMPYIIDRTELVMKQKCKEVSQRAKKEAESILKEIEDFAQE